MLVRQELAQGLLGEEPPFSEDVMRKASHLLELLERFGPLKHSILKSTKIHKSINSMLYLPELATDDPYHLRSRCSKLLTVYQSTLDGEAEVYESSPLTI